MIMIDDDDEYDEFRDSPLLSPIFEYYSLCIPLTT